METEASHRHHRQPWSFSSTHSWSSCQREASTLCQNDCQKLATVRRSSWPEPTRLSTEADRPGEDRHRGCSSSRGEVVHQRQLHEDSAASTLYESHCIAAHKHRTSLPCSPACCPLLRSLTVSSSRLLNSTSWTASTTISWTRSTPETPPEQHLTRDCQRPRTPPQQRPPCR